MAGVSGEGRGHWHTEAVLAGRKWRKSSVDDPGLLAEPLEGQSCQAQGNAGEHVLGDTGTGMLSSELPWARRC